MFGGFRVLGFWFISFITYFFRGGGGGEWGWGALGFLGFEVHDVGVEGVFKVFLRGSFGLLGEDVGGCGCVLRF